MNDLNNYIDVMLKFNPVYYSIFAVLLVVFVVRITFRYIVLPLKKEYQQKEHKLEEENTRLMALFAELDPDPVIRADITGKIIHFNMAAKNLLKPGNLMGANISEIIPELKNINEMIETSSSGSFNARIDSRDYDILIRGIQDMNFAQVYFHDVTGRKNYEKVLKEYSARVQQSIEEERKRISKELHDGIGQNLSAVRFKFSAFAKRFKDSETLQEIAEMSEVLSLTVNELREISFKLKPQILDDIGLEPALISLCRNFSKDTKIDGKFKFDRVQKKLNTTQQTCLYRIAQEALNNIRKHSDSKEFAMRLIDKDTKVKLIISDEGKGFDYDELILERGINKSMGLISMKERAESLGGKFLIVTSPGEGTLITVDIPVEAG